MILSVVQTLTGLVLYLLPDSRRVRLTYRGEGRIWEPWIREFQAHDIDVEATNLADSDYEWRPLPDTKTPFVLDIYHDPFGPSTEKGGNLDWLRDRTTPIIFVDYPHGITNPIIDRMLQDAYSAALAQPWYSVEYRSLAYSIALSLTQALKITSHNAEMVAEVIDVRTDLTSWDRDGKILQLPLGEAWALLDPKTVAGEIKVLQGNNNVSKLSVGQGEPEKAKIDLLASPIELGIGSNVAARWLPGVSIAEKALGRFHLGFGDSALIGGGIKSSHHFDVSLSPDSRISSSASGINDQATYIDWDRKSWIIFGQGSSTPRCITHGSQEEPLTAIVGNVKLNQSGRTQVIGGPSEVAYVLDPDSSRGRATASNFAIVDLLGDPRLADLLMFPEQYPGLRQIGVFDCRKGEALGIGTEDLLAEVWNCLVAHFGTLPWSAVKVFSMTLDFPKALSFPGVILVSESLLSSPLTFRWLYLVHELAHQWIGGLIRVDNNQREASELIADAVAYTIGTDLGGHAVERAMRAVYQRYANEHSKEFKRRGRRILSHIRKNNWQQIMFKEIYETSVKSLENLCNSGGRIRLPNEMVEKILC